MGPSPITSGPKYVLLNRTYGPKSKGLGGTFEGQVLTVTGLTVGESVIISYYINNPTSAGVSPKPVSITGMTTVDAGRVEFDNEHIAIGAMVCICTDAVATITFRDVASSPSYQFTAYQV